MLVTRAVQVGAAARAAALNGSPEDSLRGEGRSSRCPSDAQPPVRCPLFRVGI